MAEYQQQALLGTSQGTLYGTYKLLCQLLEHKKIAHPHLHKAYTMCLYSDSASEALAMSVARMIEWGLVAWAGDEDKQDHSHVWRDSTTGCVMVPRDLLNKVLHAGGAPTLELQDLALQLSEAKPGAHLRMVDEHYFWELKEDQFNTALTAQRRMGVNRLKVVSL